MPRHNRIGSDFEKTYFESETYLLGRDIVQQGLFLRRVLPQTRMAVWIDLRAEGLDEKLVMRRMALRFILQDIGLAEQKYREYQPEESIYVVGDRQNYHSKVLKLMTEKAGDSRRAGIFHLSYGMVELPTGKMKSREGTVVDTDDLLDEMIPWLNGKIRSRDERKPTPRPDLFEMIPGSAGCEFLLRVDPVWFYNGEESIDLHGSCRLFNIPCGSNRFCEKSFPAILKSRPSCLAPRTRTGQNW